MSTKLVDNIQNSDKKSKKQKVQEVTYAREFIPRAIYNDHITELLLRAEGPSGRPPKSEDIAPLKLDGAYKIQHSGGTKINPTFVKQNSKYNLVNQQQNNKTFVFTEESLEIVNLIYEVPIHPIPLKPKMQLPKPVYFQGRVTSHFMSTSRSGANQNILRLTPKKTKLQAKESVRKMMHGNAKNLEASTLRYNRVFVPLPMPLKQEIQRRRKASVAPTEMRIFEKDALIVPQEFLRESEESNAMQEENEKLALEIIAQLQLENDAESARLESSKNQQLNAQSPIMPVQVLEAEPSVPFELNLVTEVNSKESSIDVIKNDEKLPEITIPIVESLVPASPAQPVLTKEELDEEEWLRQQKSMFYSGLHVEPLFASTKETKAESKTKTSKNLEAPRKSPQSKDPSLQPIDKMRSLSIESIKSVKSIKEETQSKMQALYNDLNDIPNAEAEISQPAAVSSNFMLNQLGTKVSIEHSPEHAASYGKLLDTSKYSENSLEARKSKSRLSGMFKKKSKFLNAMDVQSMQVDEPTRTYSSANDDSDTASISSNKSNFKSKFKSSLGSVFSKKDRSLDIANDCKSMASLSESPNHESVSELEDDTASISSKKSGMGKFKSSIKSIFKNKDKRTSRSFNALDEEVKLENDEVIEAPIKIEETKPVKTIISTDELAKEFISITSLEDIESKKEGHSNESSSIIKAKGSMDSIVQIQQKTLVESLQNLNSSLNAVDKDSSRGNDTPMSGKFFTKAIQEKSSPITKSLEFKNYDTSPTDSTSSILTPKVISGSPKSLKKENVEKEHAEVLVVIFKLT